MNLMIETKLPDLYVGAPMSTSDNKNWTLINSRQYDNTSI